MTNVILVRHGQASAGTDNYDRLSDTGKEQAHILGEFWKKTNAEFDAAFSGSLERQQHTAELSLAALENSPKVEILEGLNEYNHDTVDRLYGQGVQSDIGSSLSYAQYVGIMTRWRNAPDTTETQSWDTFSKAGWNTIKAAVKAYEEQHPDNKRANLVFFTSGGVISTIVTQVMSSTFETTLRSLWQTRNASISTLLFNKDGISLVDYNTVPHLQETARPSLITQI